MKGFSNSFIVLTMALIATIIGIGFMSSVSDDSVTASGGGLEDANKFESIGSVLRRKLSGLFEDARRMVSKLNPDPQRKAEAIIFNSLKE